MATKQGVLPLGGTLKVPSTSVKAQKWVGRLPEYVRRAVNYPQMDVDYTMWQMLYLCVSPKKVYRTTKYHRQTKNQWARDDPAFVAIMIYFMAVSAFAYATAFHRNGLGFLRMIFYSVVVDFLLVGVVISTALWYVANTYLREDSTGTHTMEQKVEWLYAFDVHCNSYFPFFMTVNVGQYFLLPLLLRKEMVYTLLANVLYASACSYYTFVTFLGYDVLPFLQHTSVFLYPIVAVVFISLLATVLRVSFCRLILSFYFR